MAVPVAAPQFCARAPLTLVLNTRIEVCLGHFPPEVRAGKTFPAPGFWECYDQGYISGDGIAAGPVWSFAGGTSIVPPQYAAILAILNQKAGAPMGQGLINPKLYAMAQASLKNPTAVGLVDIVSGNNAYAPVPGYAAKNNYDLASGWGSVDINQFVKLSNG
jgi:hypothetical protein